MSISRQNESQLTEQQLIENDTTHSILDTIIILSFVMLLSIDVAFWSVMYFLDAYPEATPIFGCSTLRNVQFAAYLIFLACFLYVFVREIKSGVVSLLLVKSIQIPMGAINVYSLIMNDNYLHRENKTRLFIAMGIASFSICTFIIAVILILVLNRHFPKCEDEELCQNPEDRCTPVESNAIQQENMMRPLPTPPSSKPSGSFESVTDWSSHSYVNMPTFNKNHSKAPSPYKPSEIDEDWSMDEEENVQYDTESDDEVKYDVPRSN